MKKLFIFISLVILSKISYSQDDFLISNWYAYKLYISGMDDYYKADYLARSLEKNDLVIFAAFSYENNYGYVILSTPSQMDNVANYINFTLIDYELLEYESALLSKDLFLEIYSLRNNISVNEIDKKPPRYIQLGPKNELSKQLYNIATDIWLEKYSPKDDNLKNK